MFTDLLELIQENLRRNFRKYTKIYREIVFKDCKAERDCKFLVKISSRLYKIVKSCGPLGEPLRWRYSETPTQLIKNFDVPTSVGYRLYRVTQLLLWQTNNHSSIQRFNLTAMDSSGVHGGHRQGYHISCSPVSVYVKQWLCSL